MSRICFIINAGGRKPPSERLVQRFHEELRSARVDYRIEMSRSIEHSREIVERAAEDGTEQLWIGGGDGTVHVLLNLSFGRGMAAGIVPLGTVNALARALEVPIDPIRGCAVPA